MIRHPLFPALVLLASLAGLASASPEIVRSPAGTATMEILPTGGDFHRIVADLRITTARGEETLLRQIEGTAFLISDVGRVVVLTTDHPRDVPSRIRVYDLDGRIVDRFRCFAMTDPALSSDGARLAYRTREGVLLRDLRTGETIRHPNLAPFAAGPDGRLAGIPPGRPDRIQVFENGRRTRTIRCSTRPDKLVFEGEELQILNRERGPARMRPDRDRSAAGERETIPWPLAPNAQHPVGNTYGEYQNYGSAYLHPGHDVMGDPNEPVYAVADGVVKAILTTSGQWHWRIAVGEPGSGTTRGHLYAHIDEPSIAVSVGDPIVAGQYLGDLVPWPIYDFTHCHFAEVEDTGTEWFGDWLCTGNAHLDMENQTEVEAPVFEPAVGGDLLAFCDNQSSTYRDPHALSGEVDIVAHVGDRIESSWVCSVQELRYTIHPVDRPDQPVVDDKLSVRFDMALDTYQNGPIDPFLVDLFYKQDGTCRTYGDYDRREFFHILTNSNGDESYDDPDLWEAWDTSNLPDGRYVVRVTAIDVAGNATSDSMVVTTANGNPSSVDEIGRTAARISLQPNPALGGTTISWAPAGSDPTGPIRIDLYDPAGRRIRSLPVGAGASATGGTTWNGRDDAGRPVAPGVYLVRLIRPTGVETAKLQLLR
ncbi:MAG: peptidoglycan DD-metalloendopeptidase family protein [Candidatus Eisenbacteria bacterium]|nr:peptidoglycan DD-metalloendopeptidase family protein [Candidatus Latescibacterota bacterium]MBD3303025.1 peptidoglycan DD-metalloendopeptidase family protein [Candidatus Eisenbacteria bacterium]